VNFGKYLSLIPFEYHFKKEPDWYWRIRSVTAEDELAKDQWWTNNTDLFNGIPVPPAGFRVMIFEIVRTFAGTNIPKTDKPVEDGGKPVLSDNATEAEIETVVRSMPPEMVTEIWYAIGDINPFWGPARPKKAEESSEDNASDGNKESTGAKDLAN